MTRDEWLLARRQGVSASDVAGILGLSDYSTPTSVYFDKVGLTGEKVVTDEMEFGKEIEQIVAQKWARRHGVEIEWLDTLFVGPEPWMLATPDARVNKEGLEVKTKGYLVDGDGWGEEGTDEVPDHVMTQVQWQMVACGWDKVNVALFLTGPRRLRSYCVYADEELQSSMIVRCREFWTEHVLKQIAPPIDWTEASDTYLKIRFPRPKEEARQANDDESRLAHRYALVNSSYKQLEKERHALSNQLKEMIGDAKAIEGDGFKLSWAEMAACSYMVNRKAMRVLRPSGRMFKGGEDG